MTKNESIRQSLPQILDSIDGYAISIDATGDDDDVNVGVVVKPFERSGKLVHQARARAR
jgi:hypothetical protein